jgi:hypothetical protein
MRWFLVILTAALILHVAVPPASACLNDRESIKAEKEFKSSYQENQSPAPTYQPESTPGIQVLTYGGSSVGALLFIGACALCVSRTRKA